MTPSLRVVTVLLVTAPLLSIACSEGGEPAETRGAPAASVPDAPRTARVTPEMIEEGKKQWTNCAQCHGVAGEGRVGIGPSLTSTTFLSAATDAFLIRTIAEGRAGSTMPAWKYKLNDWQIEALVAYIRSVNPTDPAQLDEKPLAGDPDKGEKLFSSICSSCHGRTGAGYQESGSGTGIARKVFLSSVTDGYLRYVIKQGKSGTPMKAFDAERVKNVAALSDAEIEDVIAYLRKNAW
jgi:cytochrome c oxidase cbb3-type subunit 3